MNIAKATPEDFENAMTFLSHLETLERELGLDAWDKSIWHNWQTDREEYEVAFGYCIGEEGVFNATSFFTHWCKTMRGGLFRIVYGCEALVRAVCKDDSSIFEIDNTKLESETDNNDQGT